MHRTKRLALIGFAMLFWLTIARPGTAEANLTINTSNASDWKISNGVVTLDWNSTTGHIFAIHLTGHADNLIDTTVTQDGQPKGLYAGNVGTNLGTGPVTAGFRLTSGHYVDWWMTTAASPTNAFTYTQHFMIADNDPGIHMYFVAQHGAADIAGSIVQVQWIFRLNTQLFTTTYSVDAGLNHLGATQTLLPTPDVLRNTDPGRQVQDATIDLAGLAVPAGFERDFYTKYDYSSEEYLHRAHGVFGAAFGAAFGAWAVMPHESMAGGPSKQDLIFTNNILILEAMSNHLDNGLLYVPPAAVDSSRLWGPFYVRLNTFDATHTTPAQLYQDALAAPAAFPALYDGEGILAQNGYVGSTRRGQVAPVITGGGSATASKAWVVVADNRTNFQYTTDGAQYWSANPASGATTLPGVIPGTYRLTAYVLGQWGELRKDDVAVTAGGITPVAGRFVPENFGTAPPIWTLGTPDRSAREFRHGTNAVGQDDREYWGAWDYWNDFASTLGVVSYFATPVGTTPATNDLTRWNYVHWHTFDPGLFAGTFNPDDDSTAGYGYICPAYVGDCSTAAVPPWQVHFATTATQLLQGRFVALSVGLAATEANLTVRLNGNALTWPGAAVKASDPQVRSGLSGTYQWVVFQWDTTKLAAAGRDNVITFDVSRAQGVMYDALRMEITNVSAAPSTTGWRDYEYVDAAGYVPANDSVANN